jgi:hypothetical protein
MDDETDGTIKEIEARQGQQGDQEVEGQPQANENSGEAQEKVSAPAGRHAASNASATLRESTSPGRHTKPTATGGSAAPTDYEAQLAAKDAEIEALQAKVAEAAKTAEATEELNAEIASLKQAMADERVEFALRAAGARNIKAARALLADHGGDVADLKAAEPWMFEAGTGSLPAGSRGDSQLHEINTSATGASARATGTTGLEPAGVAGGRPGERQYRHWERMAGLLDDEAAAS